MFAGGDKVAIIVGRGLARPNNSMPATARDDELRPHQHGEICATLFDIAQGSRSRPAASKSHVPSNLERDCGYGRGLLRTGEGERTSRTTSSDEGTCVTYGFVPGTTGYTNCVQREIDARRSGKLGPSYDQRLIAPHPS